MEGPVARLDQAHHGIVRAAQGQRRHFPQQGLDRTPVLVGGHAAVPEEVQVVAQGGAPHVRGEATVDLQAASLLAQIAGADH